MAPTVTPDTFTDEEVDTLSAQAPATSQPVAQIPDTFSDEEVDQLSNGTPQQPKSTLSSRMAAREANINKPTVAGEVLNKVGQKIGYAPTNIDEAIVGAPERLYRRAGALVGDIVDVPLTAVGKAASLIGSVGNAVTGGAVTKGEKAIGSGIASAAKGVVPYLDPQVVQAAKDVGKAAKEYWNGLPESVKANYQASGDLSQAIGAEGVVAGVKGLAKAAARTPLAEKVVSGLENTASRIQGNKVRINMPEFKKGAENALYSKYGVFGNPVEVQAQWDDKIKNAASQLKDKITSQLDNPENYTTVDDVFTNANKIVDDNENMSRTDKAGIKESLADMKTAYKSAYPDGKMSVFDAQLEKRTVGKRGDWISIHGSPVTGRNATVDAQAHNTLYRALKDNVENKGTPGIKELNKQLSEMIPMERAASKQVLVKHRNNPIGLENYIGALTLASHLGTAAAGGPLAPALVMGANIASKSPATAKGMYGIAQGIKGLARKGSDVGQGVDWARLAEKPPVETRPAYSAPNVMSRPAASALKKKKKPVQNFAAGTIGLVAPNMMGHNTYLKDSPFQSSPVPPPESGKIIGKQPKRGTSGPHRLDFGQPMHPKGIKAAAHNKYSGGHHIAIG